MRKDVSREAIITVQMSVEGGLRKRVGEGSGRR
jgi:hypothetical protein